MASSYLFANQLRVHYLRWEGREGQPVILLHNLGSNARHWEWVAIRLQEEGLAPLAPDLRGHGLTDGPESGYTLVQIERDLAACLEAWEIDHPLLVGYGWSATLALDYAVRFGIGPHSPAGIILVDGGLVDYRFPTPGVSLADWQTASQAYLTYLPNGLSLDEFLDSLTQAPVGWTPDEGSIPALLADFEMDSQERLVPRLAPRPRHELLQELWTYPTRQNLARLRCPALAIQVDPPASPPLKAVQDAAVESLEMVRAHLPHLQTAYLETAGLYYAPLQAAEALAKRISAFASQLPQRG